MNNDVFVKAIADALDEEYAAAIPKHNEEHVFSDNFNKKMDKLISRQKKPYYPLIKTTFRKAILIVAAVILLGAITVAAVPQLREWYKGLFVKHNEDNADVFAVQGEAPLDNVSGEFVYYEPKYIPEGFVEIGRIKEINQFRITYGFEDKIIIYIQMPLTADNQVDMENMSTEYIDINGINAFLSYDDDMANIVWNDEYYSYHIDGNLSKNDIIKMANLVNPTK